MSILVDFGRFFSDFFPIFVDVGLTLLNYICCIGNSFQQTHWPGLDVDHVVGAVHADPVGGTFSNPPFLLPNRTPAHATASLHRRWAAHWDAFVHLVGKQPTVAGTTVGFFFCQGITVRIVVRDYC